MSFEELRTLLVEFQTVINDRPLTYVSSERDSEVLTPSLLLYGRNRCISPPLNDLASTDPDFVGPSELREQYARLSKVLKKFENIWKRDYIVSLRERHYNSSDVNLPTFKVGDLVMVDLEDHLEKGYRSLLSLGKITKLFPTSDNIIRSVEVNVNGHLYMRPLNKFIKLELHDDCIHDQGQPQVIEADPIPPVPTHVRPRRAAAVRCDVERKSLISQDAL